MVIQLQNLCVFAIFLRTENCWGMHCKRKYFKAFFNWWSRKLLWTLGWYFLKTIRYTMTIINANRVHYENSLKIYELGNISLPRGSFASEYSYFNFRVTKDFVTWEQIWVAFLFIIIILLNDLYIYVKKLQSFFFFHLKMRSLLTVTNKHHNKICTSCYKFQCWAYSKGGVTILCQNLNINDLH